MKRTALLAGVLGVLLAPAPAAAFVFGQTTGATPLPMNGHLAGGYLLLSQDALGAVGQLRLSLYPEIDFGFQGGLVRNDVGDASRTSLRLGVDFKARVVAADESSPLDVSLGAALGVDTAEDFTSVAIGPLVVVSRDVALASGQTLTPYLGAGLLLSRFDVSDEDRNDVSVPVRLGADWAMNPGVRLVGEVQLNLGDAFRDDVGLLLGVNLPF